MSFTLHGLGVSSGIAIGRAERLSHATLEVAHIELKPRQLEAEVERFLAAVESVRAELRAMKKSAETAPAELLAFIDVHSMILDDPEIAEEPCRLIRERRCNAEWALVQQMRHLVQQFERFDDPYLRERKYDVHQVTERIVKVLAGHPGSGARQRAAGRDEPRIVVAHDISPADAIAFKDLKVAAFVTDVGGETSHTAILSRSMGFPAVLGVGNARSLIRDGETLIVDGTRGVVIVGPEPRILEEFQLRKAQLELEKTKLRRIKSAPSRTIDEVDITLLANIELPSDVKAANEAGADGIGLFRSEFLFLNRGDMPNEEEQYLAYRTVVEGMKGRPVTIRTFDLGADKVIDPEREARRRPNPALGLRAIRLCLAEPRMFQTQLRAILRASAHGKVRLLIPMLAHAQEIDATLVAIEQAKNSLRSEQIAFDNTIEIGGMIEIPAAALALGMFVRRLNFLSIGTNDLIQYTLAIDRSDEQVSSLYDPLHPAVLTLIAHTLSTAERAGIPVSVCGELAGDVRMTRLLLGLGLRQFSMHPNQLLEVKRQILSASVDEVTPLVRKILRLDEPARIREQIEKLNHEQS